MTREQIAVLVMAYGGPGSIADVEPYLMDVRGGRPTRPQLVEEIQARYARIGGRSPILELTQAQAAAIGRALADAAFRPVPRRKEASGRALSGPAARKPAPRGGGSAKRVAAKAKPAKSASRGKFAKSARRPAKKRQKTSKTAHSRRLTK